MVSPRQDPYLDPSSKDTFPYEVTLAGTVRGVDVFGPLLFSGEQGQKKSE